MTQPKEQFNAVIPARAGRREWIGLAVLTLASLVYAMDLTVLHLAVPRLSAALRPTSAQLLWIIDIYGFLVAGSLITGFSAGSAIGPMLGGVLLEFFWWGSVFLLALPVMGLLLALGPRVLPEFRDPGAGRLDLRSAIMSLTAVLAVIYGLKQTVQEGFGPVPAAAVALGLVVGLLFARRQRGLGDPLIDLGLFRLPTFNVSLATNVLAIFVVIGYFLFVAQYLQLVIGLSPLQAGLWSLPSAIGFIVGTNLAPRYVHRVRPAVVLTSSFVLAAVALGMLTQLDGSNGLALVVPASLVISLALAPVFNLTTELIVGSAPPEKAGAASGISETGAELGGAMGLAILGAIGTAAYRSQLASRLPVGVPPEIRQAALETLGGAVNVAGQLPEGVGSALLAVARESFVYGLNLAAGIAAIVAIGSAVLAAALLRDVRGRDEPPLLVEAEAAQEARA